MSALQQALDIAYEVPVDRSSSLAEFTHSRCMVATLVFGGSGAGLVVLGAPIGAGIDGHLPVHGIAFTVVWTIVRWALTLLVISLLFSIFFYIGPNRQEPKWQWMSGRSTGNGRLSLSFSRLFILCDEVWIVRKDLRHFCRRSHSHLLALSDGLGGACWRRAQRRVGTPGCRRMRRLDPTKPCQQD